MSINYPTVSPLIAAGSRFPVADDYEPARDDELSPPENRAFLLRFAEPVAVAGYGTQASTPKQTTGYDGDPGKESEDFTLPDFAP
jgi:hypothetical protein